MLIGDVTVWSGEKMVVGLSGDNDVPAEHAKRISRDASAKGCRVVWHCRNGDPRDVRTYVDGNLVRDQAWTLKIEGEGEHPGSLRDGDEARAIKWAEKLIRAGEYNLAPGEFVIVRYHLRRGEAQLDRHVDVYRSEESES